MQAGSIRLSQVAGSQSIITPQNVLQEATQIILGHNKAKESQTQYATWKQLLIALQCADVKPEYCSPKNKRHWMKQL